MKHKIVTRVSVDDLNDAIRSEIEEQIPRPIGGFADESEMDSRIRLLNDVFLAACQINASGISVKKAVRAAIDRATGNQ